VAEGTRGADGRLGIEMLRLLSRHTWREKVRKAKKIKTKRVGKKASAKVRIVKRKTAKKARKAAPRYSPQTGQLTGRERGAQERLEARATELMGEGLSASDARMRARQEMRDNPTRDWRRG